MFHSFGAEKNKALRNQFPRALSGNNRGNGSFTDPGIYIVIPCSALIHSILYDVMV